MLNILLRCVGFLCFILAAVNQTIFSQPPADLIAWGLAAWILATLCEGVGPAFTITKRPNG